MIRILCILSASCLFCTNFERSPRYIEKHETFEFSTGRHRLSEILVTQKGNTTSRQIQTFKAGETEFSNATIVQDGRTKIWYINGELDSILTTDDRTNCETRRSFHTWVIYEKTTCNGHDVSTISIRGNDIFERHCDMSEGIQTCRIKNSTSPNETTYEYEYEIGANRIFSMFIHPEDETHTYSMWSTRDIQNGQQVDMYKIELPAGSPMPSPQSSGWEHEGSITKTGYIPSINDCASWTTTTKHRISKSTREIF